MTPTEATTLTEYVRACCPQQRMTEYTPDAWHDLLSDLSLADCKAAVITITKAQPFCVPSEIRAEVRRIRDERIARAHMPLPPPEVADDPDPKTYIRWLRAVNTAAGDGRDPAAAGLTAIRHRELS